MILLKQLEEWEFLPSGRHTFSSTTIKLFGDRLGFIVILGCLFRLKLDNLFGSIRVINHVPASLLYIVAEAIFIVSLHIVIKCEISTFAV